MCILKGVKFNDVACTWHVDKTIEIPQGPIVL